MKNQVSKPIHKTIQPGPFHIWLSKEKKRKKKSLCNALKNDKIQAVDSVDIYCCEEFFAGDIYFYFHLSTMNGGGQLMSSMTFYLLW